MKQNLSMAALGFLFCIASQADGWKDDPIWHDGLVEKATYKASRVIYGKPREYEAIFFTNKEQHDLKTLTKANASKETVEVWKHNQIEVIPTPNYDYKYETTSHLDVKEMKLTRLDSSSQEFCGTSFKQYLQVGPSTWDYWSFSYMPEAGRVHAVIDASGANVVAQNSLPIFLRDLDFKHFKPMPLRVLPTQSSNRATDSAAQDGEIRLVGDDDDSFKLSLMINSKPAGTYWISKSHLHVMTKYESADGSQKYELKKVERVNYWTIKGE